jgi:hypothetical protein
MKRKLSLFSFFVAAVCAPAVVSAQGDPLGPEFRVNSYTSATQALPAVAADPSGDFVAVWISLGQEGPAFGAGVFGQRFAAGGAPLGSEFRVNSYTSNDQADAAVAKDGSGNFVVVWTSEGQDGDSYGVFGQRYAASGAPLGPEFRVNTYTTSGQSYPAVAADASGNFVVVWNSFLQDGSSWGVFGQRYAGSGAPLGPEFRVDTFTTNAQWRPAVASDASGNFVVVWESYLQDGSGAGVYGQRYQASGAPLGSEFRVNTFTPSQQRNAAVATNGSGGFVVAWESFQDGSMTGVMGQRYAASGAPLGPEFRVNTFTLGDQDYPSVAADDAGDFVVIWQGNVEDGDSWGVFGQRYDSAGAPLGSEFRVNTYTTYAQRDVSVAADPSGDFVVVWDSGGQDSGTYGVFGQRYNQIFPISLTGFSVE